VDDEPLAVTLLKDYVDKTPGMQTVLHTTQVMEALHCVQEGKADLLFLDIHMPELTGIQFMKIIRNTCKVILTTAYSQYALEGYEHDVVDYLLKPITLDRFLIAAQKARERIAGAPAPTAAPPAIEPPNTTQRPDHIFVKTEYRIQRISLDAIYYIEALRDYIALHTTAGKILSLDSMKNMEETLPADNFIRIHKSYIVNTAHIDFLEKGRVVIQKEYLPVGDTYRDRLREKLGIR
jgi:DNA-binding LytR/AlgR family response regulator